ncbi:hypothetical protein RHSIM_Rhsim02G0215300 [Rhododendron simsii]|uniref:BING4 C-terminal domain-containing protein n=1 Tax=Rhododendron simsii TaxID=118357 RepID=A0A834HN01_RHOSS|nr:hypothetical protein RHSIM_Rhsim02G0215300 [Rhododendron simsii]
MPVEFNRESWGSTGDARGVQSGVVGLDWGGETGCFLAELGCCHIFLEDYFVARCSLVVTKLCYMDIHCDGSLRDSAMDENVTVEDEDQVQVEQGMGLHPEHTGSHSLLGIILSFPFSVIFAVVNSSSVQISTLDLPMGAPRLSFGMEEVYSYPLYKGFGIASSRVGAFEEFLNNASILMIVDNGNGGLYLQNFEPVKMGVKKEDGSLSKIMPPEEQEILDEMDIKVKKYLRGESANFEALRDKKLKGQLAVKEELYGKSAKAAAKVEKWLMPSEGGYLEAEGIEKTWRIKQEAIVREVDISSSKNQYDIVLPDLGPYTLDFTSSGRYMAVAGRKGHLAIIDMMNMGLIKELQIEDLVFFGGKDMVGLLEWGRNSLLSSFPSFQRLWTYGTRTFITGMAQSFIVCRVLDCGSSGSRDGNVNVERQEHGAVLKLQFLKNHFLLASINKFGQLHYQDVTTGLMVGNFRTGLGSSDVMQVNPFNSIVALGHSNGSVTMWKPTSAAPLVKMLTHHGPVSALSFHSNGHLMATAGTDRKIKIWDLRKFEVLQTLPGHAKTLDFSQKGLLATSTGSFVQILGDFSGSQNYSRYMTHSIAKGYQIQKVLFRPYEDVLGLGHSMGWSSILIPGSGEPNFDSWVANPFETPKQRREKEVRSLLDKLPPETIMLDPKKIGNLRPPTRRKEKPSKEEREAEMEAAVADAKNSVSTKRKTKGRSKPSRRAKKTQEAVERAKRPFLEQQKQEEELSKNKKQKIREQSELPKSLQRFVSKKAAS